MTPAPRAARVRFAPSPTGYLHLGGARTALFNYLLARRSGGQFILRIEDTDRQRLVDGSEENIMDGLRWLGLKWDEGPDIGGSSGPYVQSERTEIHRRQAAELMESGQAYACFCSRDRLANLRSGAEGRAGYDGECRDIIPGITRRRIESGEPFVVRFRAPQTGVTTVRDVLRGEISFENAQLEDFVLLKSDGLAVYHLAAMVDDHLMGVTHVIRGDEWLSSLPKHALIIRAFGWQEPIWCHISILKKPSGKGKMSKRDTGNHNQTTGHSIFIHDLQQAGYLPSAVVNWMAVMGWSYDDRSEDFTLRQLMDVFNLERLSASPASVSFERLDHFQGKHMRRLSLREVVDGVRMVLEAEGLHPDDATLMKVVPLIQERIVTFKDASQWAAFFFRDEVSPRPAALIARTMSAEQSLDALRNARQVLEALREFDSETSHRALRSLAGRLELKPGQLFGPVRVAVSGQSVSPPLFETMEILGREVVLNRIVQAERMLAEL